jgi:hypothetical protein
VLFGCCLSATCSGRRFCSLHEEILSGCDAFCLVDQASKPLQLRIRFGKVTRRYARRIYGYPFSSNHCFSSRYSQLNPAPFPWHVVANSPSCPSPTRCQFRSTDLLCKAERFTYRGGDVAWPCYNSCRLDGIKSVRCLTPQCNLGLPAGATASGDLVPVTTVSLGQTWAWCRSSKRALKRSRPSEGIPHGADHDPTIRTGCSRKGSGHSHARISG